MRNKYSPPKRSIDKSPTAKVIQLSDKTRSHRLATKHNPNNETSQTEKIIVNQCPAYTKKGNRCRMRTNGVGRYCHHHEDEWMAKIFPPNLHNMILVRIFLVSMVTLATGFLVTWIAGLNEVELDPAIVFSGSYFVTMIAHSRLERISPFRSILAAPILIVAFFIMSFTKDGLESNFKWLLLPILLPAWIIWGWDFSFWPSFFTVCLGIFSSFTFTVGLATWRQLKFNETVTLNQ